MPTLIISAPEDPPLRHSSSTASFKTDNEPYTHGRTSPIAPKPIAEEERADSALSQASTSTFASSITSAQPQRVSVTSSATSRPSFLRRLFSFSSTSLSAFPAPPTTEAKGRTSSDPLLYANHSGATSGSRFHEHLSSADEQNRRSFASDTTTSSSSRTLRSLGSIAETMEEDPFVYERTRASDEEAELAADADWPLEDDLPYRPTLQTPPSEQVEVRVVEPVRRGVAAVAEEWVVSPSTPGSGVTDSPVDPMNSPTSVRTFGAGSARGWRRV